MNDLDCDSLTASASGRRAMSKVQEFKAMRAKMAASATRDKSPERLERLSEVRRSLSPTRRIDSDRPHSPVRNPSGRSIGSPPPGRSSPGIRTSSFSDVSLTRHSSSSVGTVRSSSNRNLEIISPTLQPKREPTTPVGIISETIRDIFRVLDPSISGSVHRDDFNTYFVTPTSQSCEHKSDRESIISQWENVKGLVNDKISFGEAVEFAMICCLELNVNVNESAALVRARIKQYGNELTVEPPAVQIIGDKRNGELISDDGERLERERDPEQTEQQNIEICRQRLDIEQQALAAERNRKEKEEEKIRRDRAVENERLMQQEVEVILAKNSHVDSDIHHSLEISGDDDGGDDDMFDNYENRNSGINNENSDDVLFDESKLQTQFVCAEEVRKEVSVATVRVTKVSTDNDSVDESEIVRSDFVSAPTAIAASRTEIEKACRDALKSRVVPLEVEPLKEAVNAVATSDKQEADDDLFGGTATTNNVNSESNKKGDDDLFSPTTEESDTERLKRLIKAGNMSKDDALAYVMKQNDDMKYVLSNIESEMKELQEENEFLPLLEKQIDDLTVEITDVRLQLARASRPKSVEEASLCALKLLLLPFLKVPS